jgi:hypothetical protein
MRTSTRLAHMGIFIPLAGRHHFGRWRRRGRGGGGDGDVLWDVLCDVMLCDVVGGWRGRKLAGRFFVKWVPAIIHFLFFVFFLLFLEK